jgi:hypothetical protein
MWWLAPFPVFDDDDAGAVAGSAEDKGGLKTKWSALQNFFFLGDFFLGD